MKHILRGMCFNNHVQQIQYTADSNPTTRKLDKWRYQKALWIYHHQIRLNPIHDVGKNAGKTKYLDTQNPNYETPNEAQYLDWQAFSTNAWHSHHIHWMVWKQPPPGHNPLSNSPRKTQCRHKWLFHEEPGRTTPMATSTADLQRCDDKYIPQVTVLQTNPYWHNNNKTQPQK